MAHAARWLSWAGLAKPTTYDDQACAFCQYPLNGLPPGAACPECGATERAFAILARRRIPAWVVWSGLGAWVAAYLPGLYAWSSTTSAEVVVIVILAVMMLIHAAVNVLGLSLIARRKSLVLTWAMLVVPPLVQFGVDAYGVVMWHLHPSTDRITLQYAPLFAALIPLNGMIVSAGVFLLGTVVMAMVLRGRGKRA